MGSHISTFSLRAVDGMWAAHPGSACYFRLKCREILSPLLHTLCSQVELISSPPQVYSTQISVEKVATNIPWYKGWSPLQGRGNSTS